MIEISMHEETITTIQVTEDWLIAHRLPTDLNELSSGDYDQRIFEAIDSEQELDIDYQVPEREFTISPQ